MPLVGQGQIQCFTWSIMKWANILEVLQRYLRPPPDVTAQDQRQNTRLQREIPHLEPGSTERSLKGADLHSWETEVFVLVGEQRALLSLPQESCCFTNYLHGALKRTQSLSVNFMSFWQVRIRGPGLCNQWCIKPCGKGSMDDELSLIVRAQGERCCIRHSHWQPLIRIPAGLFKPACVIIFFSFGKQ